MAELNQRNQNQNRFDPLLADGAPVRRDGGAGQGRRGGRGRGRGRRQQQNDEQQVVNQPVAQQNAGGENRNNGRRGNRRRGQDNQNVENNVQIQRQPQQNVANDRPAVENHTRQDIALV